MAQQNCICPMQVLISSHQRYVSENTPTFREDVSFLTKMNYILTIYASALRIFPKILKTKASKISTLQIP